MLELEYLKACNIGSDIHEHIPTLNFYSKECSHITEAGVRTCVSTWAFLNGLKNNSQTTPKRLVSIDMEYHPNIALARKIAKEENISFEFKQGNDLVIELEETDLFFIDTWHVYGQLKRELEKFQKVTKKFLIMHDTTIDGEVGETFRVGSNPIELAESTGYPVEEITKGLWPAVQEFLENHPEWKLRERFVNCNGLTILERK